MDWIDNIIMGDLESLERTKILNGDWLITEDSLRDYRKNKELRWISIKMNGEFGCPKKKINIYLSGSLYKELKSTLENYYVKNTYLLRIDEEVRKFEKSELYNLDEDIVSDKIKRKILSGDFELSENFIHFYEYNDNFIGLIVFGLEFRTNKYGHLTFLFGDPVVHRDWIKDNFDEIVKLINIKLTKQDKKSWIPERILKHYSK